jgi:ribosomal protein S18 acetylase RimI-like enzyme
MTVDSSATAVRHAVNADLDHLEVALADAFSDDPMMHWIYPDPDTSAAYTRQFMRVTLDVGFPHGHVYTTGPNAAAAIWSPPDVEIFDDAALTTFFTLLGEQLGPRAEEVAAGLMAISECHPHDEPHFYLFVLGTSSQRQSAGLGSNLMREVLDRCDRQGLGAYLESSNIRNVPFYERHGFRVLTEVHAGEDFVARPMWRDPRG